MLKIFQVLMHFAFCGASFLLQLLDWLLGKGHSALLRRAELKTLVDMHGNEVSVCNQAKLDISGAGSA